MKKIILSLCCFLLTACNDYQIKDGKVYYKWFHGGALEYRTHLVENADAETFRSIPNKEGMEFAKDKNSVFLRGRLLKNADPNSFEQLHEYYWKDKNNVYLFAFGEALVEDANPNTFSVLKEYWAADKHHIFHQQYKMEGINKATFVPIDEFWAKDDKYYYHKTTRLDLLDYASAEVVSKYYIKDKNGVYLKTGEKLPNANPNSFVAFIHTNAGYDDQFMFSGAKNEGIITEEYRKTYVGNKEIVIVK